MAPRDKSAPTFDIERAYQKAGYRAIAGIDEAGRGALAGPLYVGLVLFPASLYQNTPEALKAVRDSKDLSPQKRIVLVDLIKDAAVLAETFRVTPEIIDSLNVNRATLYAVEEMLKKTDPLPDCNLLDGNFKFQSKHSLYSIKFGDTLSLSIAAASILAKVARDTEMEACDETYPEYSFKDHKGYGTKKHREVIEKLGPSPIHRLSYEPVKSMLSKENDVQNTLY